MSEAPLSIPELTPIFSYAVRGGGDIYFYVAQSEIVVFVVISFDDTSSERFYGVETLDGPARLVAHDLVSKAAKEWGDDDDDEEDNPFSELLNNAQAMEELTRALTQAYMQASKENVLESEGGGKHDQQR